MVILCLAKVWMALAPSFPLKTQIPRQAAGISVERGQRGREIREEMERSDIYKGGKSGEREKEEKRGREGDWNNN